MEVFEIIQLFETYDELCAASIFVPFLILHLVRIFFLNFIFFFHPTFSFASCIYFLVKCQQL